MPPKKSPARPATRAKGPVAGKNKSTARSSSKAQGTGKFSAVDQYLKTVPAWPAKAELLPHFHKAVDAVYATARAEAKALGRGLEPDYAVLYGIPTIRYGGRSAVHVALFKDHVGLLGSPTLQTRAEVAPLLAKWADKGLTTSKSCVRFSRKLLTLHGVPEDIIKPYVKLGMRDVQEILDAKKGKPTKKPSTSATKAGTKTTKAKASPAVGKRRAE
jgi:hypothetical protein